MRLDKKEKPIHKIRAMRHKQFKRVNEIIKKRVRIKTKYLQRQNPIIGHH